MNFRKSTKFTVNAWSNRLRGEVAFVIGNGPSLTENNLDLLDGLFTIGINRAFRLLLPTILMWQDESLHDDCYEDLRTLGCAKITRRDIDSEGLFSHFELVHGPFRFGHNPAILHGGGCTAALSAQLANALGCSAIVFLGVDCKYKSDRTDFYGINKHHSDQTLANFLGAMEWVNRECPIPVLNCGDVPYWPRIGLEEAIERTKANKEPHLVRLGRLL